MQSVLYVHQNYGITPATDPLLLFSFKSFFFPLNLTLPVPAMRFSELGPWAPPFHPFFIPSLNHQIRHLIRMSG